MVTTTVEEDEGPSWLNLSWSRLKSVQLNGSASRGHVSLHLPPVSSDARILLC